MPRKFTLVDAMVLIAATAIAFVPIRLLLREPYLHLMELDDPVSVGSVWLSCMDLNSVAAPLVVTWSAALRMLRLRTPRPRMWRVFRQPGMAACSAVLTASIYFVIRYAILTCYYHVHHKDEWSDAATRIDWELLWWEFSGSIALSVSTVWIVLWLGRVFRPEPSWIDRAGRVLGIYCIVCSILFGFPDLLSSFYY